MNLALVSWQVEGHKLTLDHRGLYSKFMIMEAPRKLFTLVVWMALCAQLGLSNCEDRKTA